MEGTRLKKDSSALTQYWTNFKFVVSISHLETNRWVNKVQVLLRFPFKVLGSGYFNHANDTAENWSTTLFQTKSSRTIR